MNTILMDKLTRAVVKACKTQDPGEARHIMAFHALVAQRAHFFIDMHIEFAAKGLPVFETPRLGSSVQFTLHWLKIGAMLEFQYRNDEVQNSPSGSSIVTLHRESVRHRWLDDCHSRDLQQVLQFFVGPTTSFVTPTTFSHLRTAWYHSKGHSIAE